SMPRAWRASTRCCRRESLGCRSPEPLLHQWCACSLTLSGVGGVLHHDHTNDRAVLIVHGRSVLAARVGDDTDPVQVQEAGGTVEGVAGALRGERPLRGLAKRLGVGDERCGEVLHCVLLLSWLG